MNNRYLSLFLLAALLFLQESRVYAQQKITALPPLDSISNTDRTALVQRIFLATADLRDTAIQRTIIASTVRTAAEAKLAALQADTTAAKAAIKEATLQLKNARKSEQIGQKQQKNAEKVAFYAAKIVESDSAQQIKDLPKIFRQYQELSNQLYPTPVQNKSVAQTDTVPHKAGNWKLKRPKKAKAEPDNSAVTVATPVETPPVDSSTEKSAKNKKARKEKTEVVVPQFKSYDPANDVLLHPPHPPCVLASDVRDEFSGEIRRETTRAELFRYTAPALRTYMQGRPYIIGEAAVGTIGASVMLSLTFTVNDPGARKAFGSLPKNGSATLKFLDGTTFIVNNLRNDDGAPDASGQTYTYRAQYALESALVKKMGKTGLDKIRISWATGYEDYEVQNVDLLLHLLPCLR